MPGGWEIAAAVNAFTPVIFGVKQSYRHLPASFTLVAAWADPVNALGISWWVKLWGEVGTGLPGVSIAMEDVNALTASAYPW